MRQFFAADFKDYLRIDKHDLDGMLVKQADAFYEVSEHLTSAMAERDGLKDTLAQVTAEASEKIRNKAEAAGDKMTEGRVTQLTVLSKKYQKANTKYSQAKRDAEQWSLLKEALLQRASMLKLLVNLYSTNYFTTESMSPTKGNAGEVVARNNEQRYLDAKKKKKKRSALRGHAPS